MMLLATLAGLALVDSTSLGTMLVPLWLMLIPDLRVHRFLLYLATVAGFYFVVGVVLVLGGGSLRDTIAAAGRSDLVLWMQLASGIGLFALSFRYDGKRNTTRQPDRATRWQDKVAGGHMSSEALVLLALAATGLEVMTMLPYLAAIGLITTADLPVAHWLAVLLGYVVVMVLPALVLLVARTLARRRIEPVLTRWSAWMSRHSQAAIGWVLGIVGFLLAQDAAARLVLPALPA
jgi:Sap, sulfolipid-1-addressing protein